MNSANSSETPEAKIPRRRRWLPWLVLALLLLAALPWILAKTPLRDRMLNAIVNSDDVSIRSSNASFGYVVPLSLSGLEVRSRDRTTQIEVDRIQADHSWLGLLFSRPDLGTFRFQNPRIDVTVDPQHLPARDTTKAGNPTSAQRVELPNLAAQIDDAEVVVRTPASKEPPIDLDGIGLTVRMVREGDRSVLRVEPTTVFDHQRITPELCGQGLQLIAPLLADEVAAEGEFSLRLDRFEVPIGPDSEQNQKEMNIQGVLQLHEASVGLRNTIAARIGELVFKLLGGNAPQRLTVAKDLMVTFAVVDGRFHHQGLALLLPHRNSSIEIISSGSVGLDETLDLQVTVEVPSEMLGGGNLAQRLTEKPISLAVTGSIQEPKFELLNQGGLVDSIRNVIDKDADPQAKQDSVGELIDEAVNTVGGILQGLRERSEQRRDAAGETEQGQTSQEAEGDEPKAGGGLFPNLRERLRNRSPRQPPEEDLPAAEPPPPQPRAPQPADSPEPVDL